MLPQGIYMSEIGTWDPRIPLSGLGFVFPSYYYHYLNAILPLPVREDAPVRVYNAYPLDGHVAFPLSPSIYSNPGFWSYAWSPCIVCTCYIRPVIAVDNCFNFRSPSTAVGYCDCRKVCEEDWDNPATWPQWINLPPPSPLPRPSPRPSPFPLPLGDPLPKIEVSPEVLPQLDPDTLIQPLPIPSPQRFIVRPSVRPNVEVPPDVGFQFLPDPEIEVVVEISPEELISPINWIITQEIASTAPLTDAINEAIRDYTSPDRCREREQMLYANFDELRDLMNMSTFSIHRLGWLVVRT
jgi:hypothetical protein